MFDIGFLELLIVGVVALIVVGPKDLPGMFRAFGRFTAKARGMAREFSRAMENAADESGVGDVTKDLRAMTNAKNLGLDSVKDVAKDMAKWSPEQALAPKAMGPETAKLTQERAEQARKIREATAKRALEAKAAKEAAEAGDVPVDNAGEADATPPAKKAPAKKAATKKAPAKKASTPKKPATKKPAAKKPAAAKATDEKPATKTAAAKKPAAKKPAAKSAAKSAAKKKPAAKKTAAPKSGDA